MTVTSRPACTSPVPTPENWRPPAALGVNLDLGPAATNVRKCSANTPFSASARRSAATKGLLTILIAGRLLQRLQRTGRARVGPQLAPHGPYQGRPCARRGPGDPSAARSPAVRSRCSPASSRTPAPAAIEEVIAFGRGSKSYWYFRSAWSDMPPPIVDRHEQVCLRHCAWSCWRWCRAVIWAGGDVQLAVLTIVFVTANVRSPFRWSLGRRRGRVDAAAWA